MYPVVMVYSLLTSQYICYPYILVFSPFPGGSVSPCSDNSLQGRHVLRNPLKYSYITWFLSTFMIPPLPLLILIFFRRTTCDCRQFVLHPLSILIFQIRFISLFLGDAYAKQAHAAPCSKASLPTSERPRVLLSLP